MIPPFPQGAAGSSPLPRTLSMTEICHQTVDVDGCKLLYREVRDRARPTWETHAETIANAIPAFHDA